MGNTFVIHKIPVLHTDFRRIPHIIIREKLPILFDILVFQPGELLTGRQGASAHIFKYQEDEQHDYVLCLPFRKVNMKRIAEMLHATEPAFSVEKENYNDEYELIVVRKIGKKGLALDYMNTVMKNNELFSPTSASTIFYLWQSGSDNQTTVRNLQKK